MLKTTPGEVYGFVKTSPDDGQYIRLVKSDVIDLIGQFKSDADVDIEQVGWISPKIAWRIG